MGPAMSGGSKGGPFEALGLRRHDWALEGLDGASRCLDGTFRGQADIHMKLLK